MTYSEGSDRCHCRYNAVTAVLLKAVYGKMAIKRMLLSIYLFLVGKAALSSA
jgi:hypothetical protein